MKGKCNHPTCDAIEDRLIFLGRQLAKEAELGSIHPDQEHGSEWAGADVRVTSDFTWEPKDFLEAHDLLVRTRHAPAVTGLFFAIRDIFGSWLDAGNKYAFYGSLAQAAQRHLAEHQPEVDDPRPLLNKVLEIAFEWLGVIRKEKRIPPNAEILIHSRDLEGRQIRIGEKDGRNPVG